MSDKNTIELMKKQIAILERIEESWNIMRKDEVRQLQIKIQAVEKSMAGLEAQLKNLKEKFRKELR